MAEPRPKHYFHGGPRGLWVGDALVPADALPTAANETLTGIAAEMGAADIARRDRVYVTVAFTAAAMFAALRPTPGVVYEVEPVGALEHDPDTNESGLSFMCERATVRRVHFLTPKQVRRVRETLLGATR